MSCTTPCARPQASATSSTYPLDARPHMCIATVQPLGGQPRGFTACGIGSHPVQGGSCTPKPHRTWKHPLRDPLWYPQQNVDELLLTRTLNLGTSTIGRVPLAGSATSGCEQDAHAVQDVTALIGCGDGGQADEVVIPRFACARAHGVCVGQGVQALGLRSRLCADELQTHGWHVRISH